MNLQQKCGSGTASAFGGTGNNTNAAAGSLNGNNSVANSNTNYAASFAQNYRNINLDNDALNAVPDNMTSKVEKIGMTADIRKAAVFVSRTAEGNSTGKEKLSLAIAELPLICDDEVNGQLLSCNFESEKIKNLIRGVKTFGKHKRLRNVKAFLLNNSLIKYAIYEARKNKVPTRELRWIMNHVDETADRIYTELKTETYMPKPFKFKVIHNKDEKPRRLAILGFYDRCVQALLKIVIQEKLRALEPRNVYSNLPGRGTLSNNPTYCLYGQLSHDFKVFGKGYGLKMDIHHCYESISTEVLKRELFSYITDSFTRRLITRMFSRISYLPIGDPLSGLYVNLVLRKWHMHVLHNRHYLFDRCYFFCDDMLFINRTSKKKLHQLCQEARKWFPEQLGVYVKKDYRVFPLSAGVTFCGARVFPDKILIRRKIKQRLIRARNKPRSLASYKGILDKINGSHLSKYIGMDELYDKLTYNMKYGKN